MRASNLKHAGKFGENLEWKPVLVDRLSGKITIPNGTIGSRWDKNRKWNLGLNDLKTSKAIEPQLSVMEGKHQVVEVSFIINRDRKSVV